MTLANATARIQWVHSRSIALWVSVALFSTACSGPDQVTEPAGSDASAVTAPGIRVYDPDEVDDVPDPRHIWQDECASGVAFQRMPGVRETGTAIALEEWGAIVKSLGVLGREASEDASSVVPSGGSGVWTVRGNSGEVLAVVQAFESSEDIGWNTGPPAVCTEVG